MHVHEPVLIIEASYQQFSVYETAIAPEICNYVLEQLSKHTL